MSQQINLLNPALIKQKNFLNTNNMAIMLGLLLVLIFAYYSYAQKQLSLLILHRSQVAEQLSAVQAQLKKMALLHTPHALNKALLDQITQLEQKEAMQQQVLQTVNQSSATPDKGYAALMRAFARQSLDGLWLTSFSIDSHTEQLNISGRTLQAELVPEYITRLRNEPALKGKLFAALNMRLPKIEAPTASKPPAVAPQPKQGSIIKNGKPAIPVNTATHASEVQINTPQYIEFSLQSADDKSASNTESAKSGEKS
jgi:Tfp pilus assembly protein PilN